MDIVSIFSSVMLVLICFADMKNITDSEQLFTQLEYGFYTDEGISCFNSFIGTYTTFIVSFIIFGISRILEILILESSPFWHCLCMVCFGIMLFVQTINIVSYISNFIEDRRGTYDDVYREAVRWYNSIILKHIMICFVMLGNIITEWWW